MNSLFIFDLDGTLFDSNKQIAKSANKTRLNFGFEEKPIYFYSKLIGLPAKNLFLDLEFPEKQIEKLVIFFRSELEKEISFHNPIFNGCFDFIEFIKDKDHIVSIATSKPSYLAKKVIENSKLKSFVDHIQGTDNFPAKPHPEVINRCLKNFNKTSGIMFGDRIEDMESAVKAGIKSIGVAQTTHSQKDLKKSGATLTFPDFVELNKNKQKIIEIIENEN